MTVFEIPGIILTYIAAPLILYALFMRLTGAGEEDAVTVLFLSAGLGTAAAGRILSAVMTIFPGRGDSFFITVTAAVILFPMIFFRRKDYSAAGDALKQLAGDASAWLRGKDRFGLFVFAVLAVTAAAAVFLALFIPLIGHDPLEYAMDARLIHRDGSMAAYPFGTPDPATGFYAPSTHPAGYISLIVWSYMLAGSDASFGLGHLIAPVFALHTAALLWALLARNRAGSGARPVIGALLLMTTPLFFTQTSLCHIDPLRIYTFTAALAWAAMFPKFGLRAAVPAGFAAGMALFSHSSGILILPFAAAALVVLPFGGLKKRVLAVVIVCCAAVFFGGGQYISNTLKHGGPVSDRTVGELSKQLSEDEYFSMIRGISSPAKKFVSGVLKGFSKIQSFLIAYFLALGAAAAFAWGLAKKRVRLFDDPCFTVFLLAALMFHALALLSVAAGSDIIIKNDRYHLTIQPAVCYLAACFPFAFERAPRLGKAVLCAACALMAAPVLFYTCVTASFFKSFTGDEFKRLAASSMEKFKVYDLAKNRTPDDAVFLVFRQNEFSFYTGKKSLNYAAPGLESVFGAETAEKAAAALRALNVRYVLRPNYCVPAVFKTKLGEILSEPSRSRILAAGDGFTLYELRDSPVAAASRETALSAAELPPEGRNINALINMVKRQIVLFSGRGALFLPKSAKTVKFTAKRGALYTLRARVSGEGIVNIFSWKNGNLSENSMPVPVWQSILSANTEAIQTQFMIFELDTPEGETALSFHPVRDGKIKVDDVSISETSAGPAD
jgi:hypothetical protein